jgi:hypothetical protein
LAKTARPSVAIGYGKSSYYPEGELCSRWKLLSIQAATGPPTVELPDLCL